MDWSDIQYFDRWNRWLTTSSDQGVKKRHHLCLISIIHAKRAKNKVLSTFSDFGWLDWSDIANSDSDKWYLTTDRNCGTKKAHDLWKFSSLTVSKRAKNQVFGYFGYFIVWLVLQNDDQVRQFEFYWSWGGGHLTTLAVLNVSWG